MNVKLFPILVLVLVFAGCASPEAHDASVTPAATGEKSAGACASDGDCAENQFCAKPIGDCEAEEGQCADKPEVCTADWSPVCGCNGKTYSNKCGAAAAGQNIDYEGECRGSGED